MSLAVIAPAAARRAYAERVLLELPWVDPLTAAARLADRPWTVLLHSDGGPRGRWSYLCAEPAEAWTDRGEALDGARVVARLRDALGPRLPSESGAEVDEPPFQGGAIGLFAYEFVARLEALNLPRDPDWPDAAVAIYPAILAFDHATGRCVAVGRGGDPGEARRRAERAAAWAEADVLPAPERSADWRPVASAEAYEAAVADVVARIGAGELFQANVARGWTGTLERDDAAFAAFAALAARRSAPFGAWLRLPGLALASNSPERFVEVRGDRVETRPIKGTRPRGRDAEEDDRLAAELLASVKDRAENLMIVDLMRNDLARVCRPGSVEVAELFAPERYANVHHLVSTVAGRLAEGRDAADVLAATFPPGSITGAPKIKALEVIARHEPPRGPWCGALFRLGFDGDLDSAVLIRSAAFAERAEGGWRYVVRAGAGVTVGSDPAEERAETETKASAWKAVLRGEDA